MHGRFYVTTVPVLLPSLLIHSTVSSTILKTLTKHPALDNIDNSGRPPKIYSFF